MSFSKATKGDTWNYSNTVRLKTPSWTQLMLMNDGDPDHFNETRKFLWRKSMFSVSFLFSEKELRSGHGVRMNWRSIKMRLQGACYWIMLSPLPTLERDVDSFSCRSINQSCVNRIADYEKLRDETKRSAEFAVVKTCLSLKTFLFLDRKSNR